MRWLLNCLIALVTSAGPAPFQLPPGLLPELLPVGPHTATKHFGTSRFANYLSLDLPFAPIESLRTALDARLKTSLKHRGEAHATIILPTEYTDALKSVMTIDDIATIAKAFPIDGAQISVRCLGHVTAGNRTPRDEAYFLVLEAPQLLAIRRAVAVEYLRRGGDPSKFLPDVYDPHVTVGFVQRDLHEADGVTKGADKCWAAVD